MANTKIGTDPLHINPTTLLNKIKKESLFHKVQQNWQRLGEALGISAEKIQDFSDKLHQCSLEPLEIPYELLNTWTEEQRLTGSNATMHLLSEAFATCQMNDISTFLMNIVNSTELASLQFREVPIHLVTNSSIGTGNVITEVFNGTFSKRIVAVKQLKTSAQNIDNVNQELDILSDCIPHNNTVANFCKHAKVREGQIDYFLLATEFCEYSLKGLVEQTVNLESNLHRKPSPIEILRQVIEGLEHLNNMEIFPIVLKPSDVLLKKLRNGHTLVKLSDFGTNNIIISKTDNDTQTYQYMAPEMVNSIRSGSRVAKQFCYTSNQKLAGPL